MAAPGSIGRYLNKLRANKMVLGKAKSSVYLLPSENTEVKKAINVLKQGSKERKNIGKNMSIDDYATKKEIDMLKQGSKERAGIGKNTSVEDYANARDTTYSKSRGYTTSADGEIQQVTSDGSHIKSKGYATEGRPISYATDEEIATAGKATKSDGNESSEWWDKHKNKVYIGGGLAGAFLAGNMFSGGSDSRRY
jgi:hypothetical protein